ncbi:MAG: DUF4123 domain-containing protein [Verrucomicrobiales bacterium]|nr:DUF4123 domain-containing protein [Verrucomicrobiales bacterium]
MNDCRNGVSEAKKWTVRYGVIDAARSYFRLGMVRLLAATTQCLFAGEKGNRLDDVAPHLFQYDVSGQVAELIVGPGKDNDCGILFDSTVGFEVVRRHFRRFLVVRRARDMKKVLFRFYDPRVLRAFLPACTDAELSEFFGPIAAFHCEGDDPGTVQTYAMEGGMLRVKERDWKTFNGQQFQ